MLRYAFYLFRRGLQQTAGQGCCHQPQRKTHALCDKYKSSRWTILISKESTDRLQTRSSLVSSDSFFFFILLLKWSRSARRSLTQPELQRRNPHCGHSRSSLVTIKQVIFRASAVAHVAQVNMPHFAAWQAPWICRVKQLPKCVFLHLAETRHAPLRSYRLYFFNIFWGAKKAPKMMNTSSTLGRNLCLRLASLNRCIVVIL